MKDKVNPGLVLAGGAVLLAFMGGRSILQKLGIVPSALDQQQQLQLQAAQQQLTTENYFDPGYYKQAIQRFGSALILKQAAADEYAKTIYSAVGFFNDDEPKIYGVFEAMKTKTQVSFLSERFYALYKKSLLQFLNQYLNDSEMLIVAKICNKLPGYKV